MDFVWSNNHCLTPYHVLSFRGGVLVIFIDTKTWPHCVNIHPKF